MELSVQGRETLPQEHIFKNSLNDTKRGKRVSPVIVNTSRISEGGCDTAFETNQCRRARGSKKRGEDVQWVSLSLFNRPRLLGELSGRFGKEV